MAQVSSKQNVRVRKTGRWEVAETLKTKADFAAYLDAVLEDGNPELLKAALGDVARASGRAYLCKALSSPGNLNFATVAKIVRALGLRLTIAA